MFLHKARIREQGRGDISSIPPDEHEHDDRYGYDLAYYKRRACKTKEKDNDSREEGEKEEEETDEEEKEKEEEEAISSGLTFSKRNKYEVCKKPKHEGVINNNNNNNEHDSKHVHPESKLYDNLVYNQTFAKLGWAELCSSTHLPRATFQQCYGPRTIAWLHLRLKRNVSWLKADTKQQQDMIIEAGFANHYAISVCGSSTDYMALENAIDHLGSLTDNYEILTCADALGLVASDVLNCCFEQLYTHDSLDNIICLIIEYLCVMPFLPKNCAHTIEA